VPRGMRGIRTFIIALCIVAACAQQGDGSARAGYDDPEEREAWEQESFGPAASDYLARKQEALVPAQRIARRQATTAASPPPAWRNIGPFRGQSLYVSFAGRLRAIVPHPTDSRILYVATAGGGVWKTTDSDPAPGSVWTWRPLTDGIAPASASGNLAVGGLAMDAADPETLYLALGDPVQPGGARGFFVTRDGGTTWEKGGLPDGANGSVFTVFSPAAGTVLIGGDGGLWRSSDSGRSFALVPLGGLSTVYTLARYQDGTLSCGAGSGVLNPNSVLFFSTDAGASWTKAEVPTLRFGRVSIAASGAVGWALLSGQRELMGGLLHSTDSGRSWSWVPATGITDTAQGWYNQAIAVDPDDPSRVIAGGRQPFSSIDGGASWTSFTYTHPDLQTAVWWAAAPKRLLLGHDGGLTVVRNLWDPYSRAGDSSHNDGVASQLAYRLSSSLGPGPDGQHDAVAVGLQDNGCLLGSASSGSFQMVFGGDGFSVLLHPRDGKVGLCGSNGQIWRFEGSAFTPSLSTELPFGVQIFPDESDPTGDGVYALGSAAIQRSKDFGRSWVAIGTSGWDAGFSPTVFASSRTPGTLLAINAGTGFLTRDDGTTWSKLSGPRGVGISSAWVEGGAIYVTSAIQDTTTHHVWKSLDSGRTWQATDAGLPPLPVWKVRADPGAAWVLWAATDGGVYRSGDAGKSWSRFGEGLPWVAVRDLYVAPDDSILRVATYGRGLWEVPISRPDDPAPPPDAPGSASGMAGSGGCSSMGASGLWTLIPLAFALARRFSGSRATGSRSRPRRECPRSGRP